MVNTKICLAVMSGLDPRGTRNTDMRQTSETVLDGWGLWEVTVELVGWGKWMDEDGYPSECLSQHLSRHLSRVGQQGFQTYRYKK